MSDLHGRAPFGRLHANTIAKEGSVVSPPAKAPVNRQAGPALQARHVEAYKPTALCHTCVQLPSV